MIHGPGSSPMAETLRLFILAGEPSGDRIGADLVRRLRTRVGLELTGVGGDELQAEGLAPIYPMSDLAVMGISDVLTRLPLLLWRVEQTARYILKTRPDLVVLIDAQEFSRLVATRLRAKGFNRPVLLYVAPSVWARAPDRAAKLKPLFAEILTVLPFEPAVLQRLGGPPASYVGHPALAETATATARDTGRVALLPGSREGEIRRHLPLMRALAERLASEPAVTGFFMPTLSSLAERLRAEVASWPVPVEIVAERSARQALYGETILAVSVAGTATLELALGGVPMVIAYVMDRHQDRAFERLGRPVVGLPNIVLGRTVTPEIVRGEPPMGEVTAAALDLISNKKARQDQCVAFGELSRIMQNGAAEAPRQDPADRVLAHCRKA